jgi:lipid II:glycine glycyltransferase (peptidoglycan interpeptide bridge formation enzyme)
VEPATLRDLDGSPELLQSGFWGDFKGRFGWSALPFRGVWNGAAFRLLVLSRRLARGFSFAYVPFGPPLDPGERRMELLEDLARALGTSLPADTVFLRYDLPWEHPPAPAASRWIRKSRFEIQPASTVVLDLAPDSDALLAAMKPKTRYNIKLAAKKGVEVHEGGDADMDGWHELCRETAKRDGIVIHGLDYYRGLFDAARRYGAGAPVVKLLLARHEGDLLSGNIVIFHGKNAIYLSGASSGRKRNLMPTYALQWASILMAREAGCHSYDFYGIPPRAEENHPMFGLYQFKTGFGGRIVDRPGCWDAPMRHFAFHAFDAAERMRMFFYRNIRKRIRGRIA